MRRYIILSSILSSILLGIFFLVGCGDVCAPPESTITISPSSIEVTDPHSYWRTQDFSIVVKDENGVPLSDVKIWISYPYAVPDSHGYVQLYDGDTPVDSPFWAKTDKNGVYNLRFDYQGNNEYTGDLEARSCDAFQTAKFSMTIGE